MTVATPSRQDQGPSGALPGAGGSGGRMGRLVERVWALVRVPTVALGLLAWAMMSALGGVKGAAVGAVISVGVAAALLARPLLGEWLFTSSPTGDTPPPGHNAFVRDLARRATGSTWREMLTGTVLIAMTVVVATGAAMVGEKAVIIVVGLVLMLGTVALVRNRTPFFMFALAASFSLILYKKFTPLLSDSYAVAIYITTIDVVLLFCYLIWASEGTLYQDLKRGLRNPVFALPVAGIAVVLLSSLNASDQRIVWAEIVRYLWMTAMFVYVGIRVRRREHIWAFMFGWLFFLATQAIVALSQKMTGGFLGIPILALEPDPEQPALAMEYMRPFGTQIHPTFLGCVVGMAGALIIGFALHVPKRNPARYVLLMCVPLCVALMYFSKARGSLVALVPTLAVFCFLALRKRFISPRVFLVGILVLLIGAGFMHRQVESTIAPLFGGSSNAQENWECRWQINVVGYRMLRDNPLVGVGLNSFQHEMDRYIYEDAPCAVAAAHNIAVLTAAETGMLGLGMAIVIALVYARYAIRLVRSRDPMFASLGIGAISLLVFIAAEGVNSFSMKQDVPLAMFWCAFGLVVAANRMADEGAPELPRFSLRGLRPRDDGASAAELQVGGVR